MSKQNLPVIEVRKGEYAGKPFISLHEVEREDSEEVVYKDKPLISFGKKKALAILASLDEIRDFAEVDHE